MNEWRDVEMQNQEREQGGNPGSWIYELFFLNSQAMICVQDQGHNLLQLSLAQA